MPDEFFYRNRTWNREGSRRNPLKVTTFTASDPKVQRAALLASDRIISVKMIDTHGARLTISYSFFEEFAVRRRGNRATTASAGEAEILEATLNEMIPDIFRRGRETHPSRLGDPWVDNL